MLTTNFLFSLLQRKITLNASGSFKSITSLRTWGFSVRCLRSIEFLEQLIAFISRALWCTKGRQIKGKIWIKGMGGTQQVQVLPYRGTAWWGWKCSRVMVFATSWAPMGDFATSPRTMIKTPNEGISFGRNGVHPSSRDPETLRIYAEEHWGRSENLMLVCPLICHPAAVWFGDKSV